MKAVDQLIRPHRQIYSLSDLGPPFFSLNSTCLIKRYDILINNPRNQMLHCSYYVPSNDFPKICILYLHSNSGSRLEALSLMQQILKKNCLFFCFDFSGSGLSEGHFISLGHFEKDDVHCVLEYIQKELKIQDVILWGRSMGATTALIDDYPVSMKILDSPFFSLKQLVSEIAQKKGVPGVLAPAVVGIIEMLVEKKAGFQIEKVEFKGNKLKCPAILLGSKKDKVVSFEHFEKISKKYKGDIEWFELHLEHNETRPPEIVEKILNFALKIENSILPAQKKETFVDLSEKYNILKSKHKTGSIRLLKDSPQMKKESNFSTYSTRPRAITYSENLNRSFATKRESIIPYKVKEVILKDDFQAEDLSLSFEKEKTNFKEPKILDENMRNIQSFGDYFLARNIKKRNSPKSKEILSTKPQFKTKIMKILKENKVVETKLPYSTIKTEKTFIFPSKNKQFVKN